MAAQGKTIGRRFTVRLLAAVTAGMLVSVALAQHAPTPHGAADAVVTEPATSQPAGGGTLPSGHPGIGGGGGGMPAGHPGMPGGLPSGHVPIDSGPKTGALRVLISQGTPGGTAIEKDPVTVELYARGKILKTYHPTMDAQGVVELKDLPLE
ncbi:MAG: hypothetical protein WCI73_05340, partial [Phycisphaerae bacterium]